MSVVARSNLGGEMDKLASKEVVDHILSHHGVKGMHWGVRQGKGTPTAVSVTTKTGPRGKAVIKTAGGKGLSAHPDAIAAKVVTQKLKKSGMHTLSNQELQSLSTRANLEQQVHRSGAGKSTALRGLKHVTNFVRTPQGKATLDEASKSVTTETGKKIVKHVVRGLGVASLVV